MRKIINSTFVTVDGVIEDPQDWPESGIEDGSYAMHRDLLFSCDAVLMGRHTYDGFAASWPTRSGDEYSDRINDMAKYVVSSTLQSPQWNNTTVITGDPVGEIRQLKSQPGMDIVQYGFGRLSHTLMSHGLLDELRLWLHPFFLGRGGPEALLYEDCPTTMLSLVEAKPLKSGTVILSYRFDQAGA
jgi:dihydrofolate reductase